MSGHLGMSLVRRRSALLLNVVALAHVVLSLRLMVLWLLMLMLLLLLLGRSLLLTHILLHVGLNFLEMLSLRHIVLLLELIGFLSHKSIAGTHSPRLHLQRLLVTSRFSLQDDVYTYELSFAAIDRAPFVLHTRDAVLDGSVVLPELVVLIFNKLVDDPATVRRGNFSHLFLDVTVIPSELL